MIAEKYRYTHIETRLESGFSKTQFLRFFKKKTKNLPRKSKLANLAVSSELCETDPMLPWERKCSHFITKFWHCCTRKDDHLARYCVGHIFAFCSYA